MYYDPFVLRGRTKPGQGPTVPALEEPEHAAQRWVLKE